MSLTFETAKIIGLHHKVEKPGITGKIEIVGTFTARLAEAMDARWVVFDKEQIIKGGFKSIDLTYHLNALRLRFTPKGNLERFVLDVVGQAASKFKVMTFGDGKKKAKRMLVRFKVDVAGSQVPLIQYLEQIGGAEGKLELLPDLKQDQKQMFGDDVKAAAETAKAAEKAAVDAQEAEDPRAWMKDVNGWPIPNKSGVYNERHAQTEKMVAKGGECIVRVLQIAPDQWTWGYSISLHSSGQGSPLSGAPLPTKQAAIAWGWKTILGILENREGKAKEVQQIAALRKMIEDRLARDQEADADGTAEAGVDVSFADLMKQATTAAEGRAIFAEIETAIRAIETEGGIKVHTVGEVGPNHTRGFSTVTPKEWKAVEKRIHDNGNGVLAARFRDLVADGRAACEVFTKLVAKENRDEFLRSVERSKQEAGDEAPTADE